MQSWPCLEAVGGSSELHHVRSVSQAALLPDSGLQCCLGEGFLQEVVRPGGRDGHPGGAAVQVHDQTGQDTDEQNFFKKRKEVVTFIQ